MNKVSKHDYNAGINRAIDYIEHNISRNLTVGEIAREACFSTYHFHRLFSAFVGESLHEYVCRIRLEKAATALLSSDNCSITEIAFRLGFSSSANFAKAFKQHFNITPRDLRNRKNLEKSSLGNIKSKNGKVFFEKPVYAQPVINGFPENGKMVPVKVEIKTIPGIMVAYMRHSKGYTMEIAEVWYRLINWAEKQALICGHTRYFGVAYDNPDVTNATKCRYDACVTVPSELKSSENINLRKILGGTYAVYHFTGNEQAWDEAYRILFSEWLPNSGCMLADKPCIEEYLRFPETPENHFYELNIMIPVIPF